MQEKLLLELRIRRIPSSKNRGDDFPAFLIREVDKLKESLLASFAENFPSTILEAPSGEKRGEAVVFHGEKGG